jgi:formylglycine-generating enzyme required for sulfatase activity
MSPSGGADLDRLASAAARHPEDADAWLALARAAARHGRRVSGLGPTELPQLLAHWHSHPSERCLTELVLPSLGLAPATSGDAPRGWAAPGGGGPEAWDPETGLPLRARRSVDGAPVCLVPLPGGGRIYLDRYPVTAGRFARFLTASGRSPPAVWREDDERDQLRRPDCPVIYVSFQDAEAYGAWAGGHLPTPDEWERAAGHPEFRFPWGDETPDPARAALNPRRGGPLPGWWDGLAEVDAHPAGASPWGVEDLVGNVFEWARGSEAARAGGQLLMGCSWTHGPGRVPPLDSRRPRGVTRIPNGLHDLGFRLAVEVPAPAVSGA